MSELPTEPTRDDAALIRIYICDVNFERKRHLACFMFNPRQPPPPRTERAVASCCRDCRCWLLQAAHPRTTRGDKATALITEPSVCVRICACVVSVRTLCLHTSVRLPLCVRARVARGASLSVAIPSLDPSICVCRDYKSICVCLSVCIRMSVC